MHKFFLWLSRIWTAAYIVALALFLIGVFGLFGQEQDPLSAIFLIPLGFPWFLASGMVGDAAGPWIAALSPLINILIFRWLAHRTAPGRG